MKTLLRNLKSNRILFFYGFIVLFWLIAIASRFLYNGLVYGLDFGIYQPDGIYYALRTFNWLGHSNLDSANLVANWYQIHSAKHLIVPPEAISTFGTEVWGLIAPRILYPLLSMPFVLLFGIQGMMVIPMLSLLLLMVCTFKIGQIYKQELIGFCIAIGFSISPTVLRWTVANITDSLLLGLFALAPIFLIKSKESAKYRYALLGLIILTNMTRFSFPMWFGIGIIVFVMASKKLGISILVVNLLSSLPTFWFQPKTAFLPLESDSSTFDKLLRLPVSAIRVGFYEIAEIAVLDRILLVFLMAAFVGAVISWREIQSQYFFAVLLAVWALGAINGNIGINFRYQLPLLVFSIIPFFRASLELRNWSSRNVFNVVS